MAGSYSYQLDLPRENPETAAAAAWLSGESRLEIALQSWLVLRPIRVSEADFTGVDHVGPDGKVMLKALEVSTEKISRTAQMNAFHADWFGADAGNVAPIEGASQKVDDLTLTWERVQAQDGFVDFAAGMSHFEYCVGYAWTEFEMPANRDAWLGIGSDDGLKIWHNGELVNDRWIRRPSRIDEDIIPLRLKKGKNRILMKIQNATREWSFMLRLRVRN